MGGCSFPGENEPLEQVGHKEGKRDVQHMDRCKCELMLGGSGNGGKDAVKAGKRQKEGFQQGFSWSHAQWAVSQEGTGSGSARSSPKGCCKD